MYIFSFRRQHSGVSSRSVGTANVIVSSYTICPDNIMATMTRGINQQQATVVLCLS